MPTARAAQSLQAQKAQGSPAVQVSAPDHRGEAPQWLCYVTYDDVTDYEARGWRVSGPLRGNHGHYSILMIWEGQGEPG
jgi:hypothetical protein